MVLKCTKLGPQKLTNLGPKLKWSQSRIRARVRVRVVKGSSYRAKVGAKVRARVRARFRAGACNCPNTSSVDNSRFLHRL